MAGSLMMMTAMKHQPDDYAKLNRYYNHHDSAHLRGDERQTTAQKTVLPST